ncbi:SIR2 family protein [Arthrobacter sp. YA7-1]|uniref:SIR2 family protein n=1 Tax=Arthrobacter sp. YA7-1 TaxID=2987701 RepID=UPI002226C392|nr:SIR2 family protein [Arthrobacter sp. YA7-1]UYY83083.1 SIR2 family protein [Arthrobacter sp. YA7-1]
MESLTDQVAVPRDLLDALQNDRLVVFAGAGASMGAPTNLPNFKELARQLAIGVGYPHVLKNGEPIDAYLGQIEGYCGTDLDRLTEDLLSVRRRSPNSLHMAIASLASVSTLRLVTTNYDQCFQSALKSLDLKFTEYVAPVLPLGDAFTGIVHLHGQAPLGPGQELVLTDSDFGRAYVNRGWATRFLTEMFENFTVLFVGYSGDDTIMRYLTRGLPPASKHYAFTAPEGEASWRALGIVPLVYPPGVDHGALPEAIVAMVDQASDDPIEHFRRVIQIVDSGFPLNAVDETYIRRICAKAEGYVPLSGGVFSTPCRSVI